MNYKKKIEFMLLELLELAMYFHSHNLEENDVTFRRWAKEIKADLESIAYRL